MFIGASVYRSKGIGGGFPVDCITVRPYAKAFTASNFLQLSTSLCRSMTFHHHHYPPFVSLSSATVCLVNLGDNSWIICMPGAPNGYPPWIAGFVKCISGRLRCHCPATEYLLRTLRANKIKPPIYKSQLIPALLVHNVQTRTRFRQRKTRKKCNSPILACRHRTTICIF